MAKGGGLICSALTLCLHLRLLSYISSFIDSNNIASRKTSFAQSGKSRKRITMMILSREFISVSGRKHDVVKDAYSLVIGQITLTT